MSAQLIDGKAIAAELRNTLQQRVALRRQQGLSQPGLAVILVGEDAASSIYVANKRKACEEVGIHSLAYDLPATTSQQQLVETIQQLNSNSAIHGILVQFPLPSHIDTETIIETIAAAKDVDGFHPYNIGRLAVRLPTLRSCTPYGVMKLLHATGERIKGKHAVIVGASNHVGRPMGLELLLAGATVTTCHRFTTNTPELIAQADIVVVAVGKPGLVCGEWIKHGAIVIDIGINRLADGKLVGDVEYESAVQRAGWITPVPGGVGPMTVATLIENTVIAAEMAD